MLIWCFHRVKTMTSWLISCQYIYLLDARQILFSFVRLYCTGSLCYDGKPQTGGGMLSGVILSKAAGPWSRFGFSSVVLGSSGKGKGEEPFLQCRLREECFSACQLDFLLSSGKINTCLDFFILHMKRKSTSSTEK